MEGGSRGSKKHIVLVHGACHGAWSWYKVSTLLRGAGHRVTALDLSASGIDPRPIHEVTTMADYSRPLMDLLGSLPPGEDVILVGHSLGGLSIALAMECFPEKVAAGVFVAAFMPDSTSTPSLPIDKCYKLSEEYAKMGSNGLSAWMDTEFEFDMGPEKPPTSILFGPKFMSCKLYQLCPPEDLTLGMTLVRVGSLFQADLSKMPPFSKDRYGSVDRVYVVCGQDAAITEDLQRWMIKNYPVTEVKEIEGADHMVMLSRPEELFRHIHEVANTYA